MHSACLSSGDTDSQREAGLSKVTQSKAGIMLNHLLDSQASVSPALYCPALDNTLSLSAGLPHCKPDIITYGVSLLGWSEEEIIETC